MVRNLIRALRLPFLSATILPFVFGSLLERHRFDLLGFLYGLIAVGATHLSANLINDYADSRSGADWQDLKPYNFFGGSKLIQEGVFSELFFLTLAVFFALLSASAVMLLALHLRDAKVFGLYAFIITLSWLYSFGPLALSYRRLGEIAIFVLCGPALVMGGYFIQSGIFPDLRSFILSLPFGLLTMNILFANEVPDVKEDSKAGKFTWASVAGIENAFWVYQGIMLAAFASVAGAIACGYLSPWALFSFAAILPALKAARILKVHYNDKTKLLSSSQLTIMIQTLVSMILIVSIVL